MTVDDLCERFLDFADRVCSVVESLPDTRLGRRIEDQLLRSGTSPLGNYEDACAAESKNDFAHKLGICLKEVRESRAWLRLTARNCCLLVGLPISTKRISWRGLLVNRSPRSAAPRKRMRLWSKTALKFAICNFQFAICNFRNGA
ncbi:MAG TPA: four helix bundle protein [Lacipirellulaceae bacterium]|nr:four helix bundle protein [Lacipirellulaceae bacterium]